MLDLSPKIISCTNALSTAPVNTAFVALRIRSAVKVSPTSEIGRFGLCVRVCGRRGGRTLVPRLQENAPPLGPS